MNVKKSANDSASAGDSPAEIQRRLELAATVTARLSHDFGNYLTGIMGFTELSMFQLNPDSAPYRFLKEVLQSAQEGAIWLRRLHLFCGGASPMLVWPTWLPSVLAEEEARLRAAGIHALRWETELPNDLPLVGIEASLLQTALGELVTNAREATRDLGTIRFTARVAEFTAAESRELLAGAAPGRYVELTVADDGPGIPVEHRDKILRELFFSTKPKQRGLGLLVVYGILHRMGGAMRIGAAAERHGAKVHMYLPVADLDTEERAAVHAAPLLLVQPDPHLRESMGRILEGAGYSVRMAASAEAALAAYTTARPPLPLVVAEAKSPQLAGLELARRILEHEPKAAKFLFLLTPSSVPAWTEEEMLERFPPLRWPTEPRNFLQAVAAALARPK
jgi:two-component system, cell cycle sensor histidine kinase and response regulator CckA